MASPGSRQAQRSLRPPATPTTITPAGLADARNDRTSSILGPGPAIVSWWDLKGIQLSGGPIAEQPDAHGLARRAACRGRAAACSRFRARRPGSRFDNRAESDEWRAAFRISARASSLRVLPGAMAAAFVLIGVAACSIPAEGLQARLASARRHASAGGSRCVRGRRAVILSCGAGFRSLTNGVAESHFLCDVKSPASPPGQAGGRVLILHARRSSTECLLLRRACVVERAGRRGGHRRLVAPVHRTIEVAMRKLEWVLAAACVALAAYGIAQAVLR